MFFTSGLTTLRMMEFANFIQGLTSLRIYCLGTVSKKFDDYLNLYADLKNKYESLQFLATPLNLRPAKAVHRSDWKDQIVEELFRNIDEIFQTGKLSASDLKRIATLIANFEVNHELDFCSTWSEACTSADTYEDLWHGLGDAVVDLLKSRNYDAAVVAAFKHLDGQLQNALGVSPHEYYGEKLINLAFAPNIGKLQLGTNESEQQGMRNFFSGANAVFRNSSAHRFTKHTDFSAHTIIYMVAMMADMVRSLRPKKRRRKLSDA